MAISDTLHEAEADLAALAELPGAIRDRVRAGLAELRRLHDAVEAELARLTGGAEATLKALEAMAPPPAEGAPAEPGSDAMHPPPAEADKPPLTF